MVLAEDEKNKLKIFSDRELNREQIKIILGRNISKNELRHYKGLPSKKHTRKLKSKIINKEDKIKEIKENLKLDEKVKMIREERFRKLYKNIAIEAAEEGQRKINKKEYKEYHFVKSLFKERDTEDYKIIKIKEYRVEKFKTNLSEWKIEGHVNLYNIHKAIRDLVDNMTFHLPENIKIQISLIISSNDEKRPTTKLLSKNEAKDIVAEWVNYFMDYKDIDITSIIFKLLAIEIPKGSGKRVNKIIDVSNSRCIITVKNDDTTCLVKAIIVGLSVDNIDKLQEIFKGKLNQQEINMINKSRQSKTQINEGIFSKNEIIYLRQNDTRKLLSVLSFAFHRIYKIDIKEHGNDLQDLTYIEDKLDIEVSVYNIDKRIIYNGNTKPIKIYILLNNNHYDVISMIIAFNSSADKDRDMKKCKACHNKSGCDKSDYNIICEKCNKRFYSPACLGNHINNNKCLDYSYFCINCHRIINSRQRPKDEHICGEILCPNCKEFYTGDHKCFLKRKNLAPPLANYIFYDFETTLVDNKHIVNYCIAQYFNGDEFIFTNIDEFCSWVFNKKHKGYTLIAHYGKGYDFQFVAEWLISKGTKPNIINNGQKILLLEVKNDYNIRFIDSISFTLMPLRDFPKTFGINELEKGYFPHKFNVESNKNYIGNYPDKEYYGYNEMKKEDKNKFDAWYVTTENKIFNYKEEMYKYCKSDVDILRRGCTIYRDLFLEISNIDPFQYITLASVCSAIYKNEFLPENTIAVCKENPSDSYSIKSIKWLKYLSMKNAINIKHACNGGEFKLNINGKNLKVDGYHEETKTIYQFHGCYYHGCNECYNDLTINEISGYYMKDLYKKTILINNLIQTSGYNLVITWEHEFDSNKEMKNITLSEYDLIEPPKIRDSFFGGRTEPIKLLRDFKENNEKGKYIDVCSLYPTVMYYDKYPIGHPEKIIKPQEFNKNWYGFIYCKVLPPRGLYLPVLPYKQNTKNDTKLLFGLCKSCMENINYKCFHYKKIKCKSDCKITSCKECKDHRKILKQTCSDCYNIRNSECMHPDYQRSFIGFWTTVEINKAIEKGYIIESIYEVWHFENTSTNLWKGYIRKFLKIKMESSEFKCSEDEYRSKAKLLEIELDKLEFNPGLRFISKICLNSLWGKFGQNPKVKHTEYIDNEKDFYKIVLNDKIENLSLAFLNDSMIYTSFERKDEFLRINYNANIYIACFTTALARKRLYDMLEKLDSNVCYCDTDSIVYIENEKTKMIVEKYLGDSLGEWTDELKGKHMDFWCCAQAKDYGYIQNDGKQIGKVKGFRVNADSEEKMTNEERINLIKGVVNTIDVNYNNFIIKNCQIFTKHMVKQWAFKFDKRRIIKLSENEIDTLPYGY
jgi:hypothetical protein